jgi:threonine/homoserine/homoserine lactone efflux protein
MEFSRLYLFMAASLALLLTPGPAVLYILARSIDHGRRAGLVSVLSIESGNLFHVLAATFGLSALVMSSITLFTVVKYLGAAYLVYLGVRKLLSREALQFTPKLRYQSLRRIYSQGVVVAVLNPKTALFFLAFLPQFVDPGRGSIPLQMLTLGCIFVGMACVTDSLYAILAGTAGQWLRSSRRFLQGQHYFAGSIYIGLGLIAALADAAHK